MDNSTLKITKIESHCTIKRETNIYMYVHIHISITIKCLDS